MAADRLEGTELDTVGAGLAHRLLPVLEGGPDTGLSEDAFNDLALEIFRYQVQANPVFGAFCRGRGIGPGDVDHWTRIPAVPTSAFKAVPLVSGDPGAAQATFHTSGTTRGAEGRGVHRILDLRLYHAALLSSFRAFLLPDGARLPLLSLIPTPERVPDSSLSHMMGVVRDHLSLPGGGTFVDPDAGLDARAFLASLERHRESGQPVLIAGTAFSFVHWLDSPEARRLSGVLPEGSRIMETGGFKGRSRVIPREALYEGLADGFGIAADHIVNEYGMTELCSQFYEPVLRVPGSRRYQVPPPWVRSRVLDPVTLEEVPRGEVGILAHMDLANVGSVTHILTEDQGVREDPDPSAPPGSVPGFRILGRTRGAEPRGCSLAMEEIVVASRTADGGTR